MEKKKIKKIYTAVILIYVALVTSFYFLAGEQLWYREAGESIKMVDADSISEEINKENELFQYFKCKVDKIDSFEFVFTKNYAEGSGNLFIDIVSNAKVIGHLAMPVKDVPEQHRVYLNLEEPIRGALDKPMTIRITSDSEIGQGVHAMMYSGDDTSRVHIGNGFVQGTICFSLIGSEKINTSRYYWFIMGGIGLTIAIVLFISYKNIGSNKQDYLVVGLNAIERYKFLISQLVTRDFKTKYKRSVFGVFWSFLNPLMTMLVQFLVFSKLFSNGSENYPVYLISGVICFAFFNECTSMCLNSLVVNSRLITKVYIPKYIFPLARTLSSSINLGISLAPLLIVAIITGTKLHMSIFLMLFFLVCLIIFSLGIGMILATLMVFFKDIQFLWSVFLTMWQYATPIFYPAEIIPERFRFIVRFNPLYHFIGNARKCLIDGISPEPRAYIYCLLFAFGSLAIGSFIFKKCQDKFTLYL